MKNINFMIKSIFGDDAGYVVDGLAPMSITYTLNSNVFSETLQDSLNALGVLPKPAACERIVNFEVI
jgi:hypothetical protein